MLPLFLIFGSNFNLLGCAHRAAAPSPRSPAPAASPPPLRRSIKPACDPGYVDSIFRRTRKGRNPRTADELTHQCKRLFECDDSDSDDDDDDDEIDPGYIDDEKQKRLKMERKKNRRQMHDAKQCFKLHYCRRQWYLFSNAFNVPKARIPRRPRGASRGDLP